MYPEARLTSSAGSRPLPGFAENHLHQGLPGLRSVAEEPDELAFQDFAMAEEGPVGGRRGGRRGRSRVQGEKPARIQARKSSARARVSPPGRRPNRVSRAVFMARSWQTRLRYADDASGASRPVQEFPNRAPGTARNNA